MTVLAFAMQKGGVGKTTSTLATGVELAKQGASVLLVDLDPQSNLTQAVGISLPQVTASVFDVLMDPPRGPSGATLQTAYHVDIIPATLALARAELVLAGNVGRELLLRRALQPVRHHYDYILIDSPPSLGIFTLNALAAADAVIVPLQAHVFALQALPHLEETITLVQQLNTSLHIGGIVITMMDRRTTVNTAVERAARDQYGNLVFQTVVPFTVKLVEAPAAGEPISVYAPNSPSAVAYTQLAQEVATRYGR